MEMKTEKITARDAEIRRLIEENRSLSQRVEALSSLMETTTIINSALDLNELLKLVLQKAQSVMGAEASSIFILNEEKQVLECPVALGEIGDKIEMLELPLNTGIAGWVATHGIAQIVPDVAKDPRYNPVAFEQTGYVTCTILAAPLKIKDKIIGVAEVINPVGGGLFSEEDQALFSTFCKQVAMALENARIHQLELEQQRMSQQLQAARVIQESFLPDSFPIATEGQYDLAAISHPAATVGGDMYDFVEIDERHLGIAIGDVSGKGIPASLFMARLVSDFRQFAMHTLDPARLFNRLNNSLAERSSRGMFLTGIYGILDTASGRFSFSNAGHLPLLWVQGRNRGVKRLQHAHGIPLGIRRDIAYTSYDLYLEPGDYLVKITDGTIEAKNANGEEYSLDRVVHSISAASGSAAELIEDLFRHIKIFAGDERQFDDLTVVALRWLGNKRGRTLSHD